MTKTALPLLSEESEEREWTVVDVVLAIEDRREAPELSCVGIDVSDSGLDSLFAGAEGATASCVDVGAWLSCLVGGTGGTSTSAALLSCSLPSSRSPSSGGSLPLLLSFSRCPSSPASFDDDNDGLEMEISGTPTRCRVGCWTPLSAMLSSSAAPVCSCCPPSLSADGEALRDCVCPCWDPPASTEVPSVGKSGLTLSCPLILLQGPKGRSERGIRFSSSRRRSAEFGVARLSKLTVPAADGETASITGSGKRLGSPLRIAGSRTEGKGKGRFAVQMLKRSVAG